MASVTKRKWTGPDGTAREAWMVRYTDSAGKRRGKTFERKKDADKFRDSVKAEMFNKGFANHIEEKTIAAVAKSFMIAQERRYEDGEIGRGRLENISMAVRTAILPQLGKRKMKDLTALDVEHWYEGLRKHSNLTARTARDRVRELKLMLDYGVRHKFCSTNPAQAAMRSGLQRRPTKIVRTFSRDDIAALLAAAESRFPGQHERSYALLRIVVHLAAFCGLRWGEIFGLPMERVHLEERVIEVRHSITEWDELKGPKTAAGNRDVPLPAHIGAMLSDWIDRFYYPNERDLLFRVGTPEDPKMLSAPNFHTAHWRKLLTRAGLACPTDHLHFHALRHFAASWWIMNGMPLPDTATLLGHSKFDMTLQTYAHGIVGGHRRAEMLDNMSTTLLASFPTKAPAPAARLPHGGHMGEIIEHNQYA